MRFLLLCSYARVDCETMAALRRRFAEMLIPRMIGSRLVSSRRMMSTSTCPWLLLPPQSQGVDKYYSLGEKSVMSIETAATESEWETCESEFVGSSHGWVALLNKGNNDVFLWNPISRRRITLQPLGDTLSYTRGRPSVSKVILSSPPGSGKSRAVMTFGPGNRMAFCSLNCSRDTRWTPLGELFFVEDPLANPDHSRARLYEDIICCDRRRVLTGITPVDFDLPSFEPQLDFECQVEIWDITHPRLPFWESDRGDTSPETISLWGFGNKNPNTLCWVLENIGMLEQQCIQIPHLVFTGDELYLVMRFVALVGPDGLHLQQVPCCPIRGLKGRYRCQTFGFVALKLSRDGCYEVVDDLDGMAMFVGVNNSFAISASRFPELKPNSIYFTDAKRHGTLNGVADTGIFDYQSKTISPIIIGDDYPLQSSPIWFDPPAKGKEDGETRRRGSI